jgi:hypothetical protein
VDNGSGRLSSAAAGWEASGCEVAPESVMLLLLHGDRPGSLVTPERNIQGPPVVRV